MIAVSCVDKQDYRIVSSDLIRTLHLCLQSIYNIKPLYIFEFGDKY